MKIIRRLITLVGKRVNNSLILNAMAKTYSKTPKTDSVQLTINALFSNAIPIGADMQETHICENLLIFLKRLVNGHRFKKKHFEDLFLNIQSVPPCKSEIHTEDEVNVKPESEYQRNSNNSGSDKKITDDSYSYERLFMTLDIISTLLSNDITSSGPQNFIYFNGYNSGITTFKKKFEKSPFNKVNIANIYTYRRFDSVCGSG
jgi:hypothetical protein